MKPTVRDKRHIGTGTFTATPRMHELVTTVLDSGRISYGKYSQQFEREFASRHDSKYAILSNSGTSSLHVALQTLKHIHKWSDGAGVIVPSITFIATVNVILHNNLRPVFVDVKMEDYGIDPWLIHQAIEKEGDIVCVIPVHMFGQPCDMSWVKTVTKDHDIKVIEDSCETMFAKYFNQSVGSMGDIGCFSTYNAHIITTGVGGIATTNDERYAAMMRSLVNHGLSLNQLNVDENYSPHPMIGRSFKFAFPGHSYRITELEAVLGLAQLEDKLHILSARQRNARHLTAGLQRINEHNFAGLTLPIPMPNRNHVYMMYPILTVKYDEKEPLLRYLNEHSIETRDMMPITNQPIFENMIDPIQFPIADKINRSGFYIGCHQDLEPDDIEYVLEAFRNFFRER